MDNIKLLRVVRMPDERVSYVFKVVDPPKDGYFVLRMIAIFPGDEKPFHHRIHFSFPECDRFDIQIPSPNLVETFLFNWRAGGTDYDKSQEFEVSGECAEYQDYGIG